MHPHLLFTVDASQVDFALVRSFLELDIEENSTVEYKRNGDAALDAMANTYGGMILLVGVDANSQAKDRPEPVVGVPTGEKEKLVTRRRACSIRHGGARKSSRCQPTTGTRSCS